MMSSLTTKKAIAYTFKDLLKEKPFNNLERIIKGYDKYIKVK